MITIYNTKIEGIYKFTKIQVYYDLLVQESYGQIVTLKKNKFFNGNPIGRRKWFLFEQSWPFKYAMSL